MDLNKILGGLENGAELIKQIEAEIGKEFVPRAEFNTKNNELKERDKQLGELNKALEKVSEKDQTINDLTGQVKSYETASLKARIAHETGLPYELAGRLSGADEKEIRADAESLLKFAPKQALPPLKSTEPPAGNSEKQEFKSLLSGLRGE